VVCGVCVVAVCVCVCVCMVLERPKERGTRTKGQEVSAGGRKRGRDGGPCERLDRPEVSRRIARKRGAWVCKLATRLPACYAVLARFALTFFTCVLCSRTQFAGMGPLAVASVAIRTETAHFFWLFVILSLPQWAEDFSQETVCGCRWHVVCGVCGGVCMHGVRETKREREKEEEGGWEEETREEAL
jgi:hypothetical protein